jgi:hypothetical protein
MHFAQASTRSPLILLTRKRDGERRAIPNTLAHDTSASIPFTFSIEL